MSTNYSVRINYVDDSYWDDGSRWTYATFKFNSQKEAVSFASDAVTKGYTIDGQNGKVRVRPDMTDVNVYRHTTTEVKWSTEVSK